jgi:hypothetical protein
MPGTLLDANAVVLCSHGASAKAAQPSARVKANNAPIVTLSSPYTIDGCPHVPPPPSNQPCSTAQFAVGASRVKSMNQPVLLQDGKAVAMPSGTPLNIVSTQTRVKGQ